MWEALEDLNEAQPCDEFITFLWRSQAYHVAKTSRRPYIEDLSKATKRKQHQNEVVSNSTSN